MSILDIPQEEYFKYLRDKHIVLGGTDVGAILGLNRYKTPADVFDNKLATRPPVQRNRDMDRGIALEAPAARVYAMNYHAVLRKRKYLRHPNHAFLGGTPDREIVSEPGHEARGILEIKCFRENGYDQTLVQGIDQSYHAQLQWYLGLAGYSWGAFCVFNAERWEAHRIEVPFDAEWYEQAVAAAVNFWHNNILTRQRPAGDDISPLASQLPRVGAVWRPRQDAEFIAAASAFMRAKENKKLAEESEKRAYARLTSLMEPGERVIASGMRISWMEYGRKQTDLEWLAMDNPTLDLSKYVRQTVYKQLRCTRGAE